MKKENLNRKSDVLYEISQAFRNDMRVPAHIYTTDEMLSMALSDRSLHQLVNISTLPGVLGKVVVMPDVHEGYGFPIGAVAAIDYYDGVISPGGIGYDINCGVRLIKTNLNVKDIFNHSDILSHKDNLAKIVFDAVPSGVGQGGYVKLDTDDLKKALNYGGKWAVSEGFGIDEDMDFTESSGCMESADASAVSGKAMSRGKGQLGTLGAGNHFVEIDRVSHILDEATAESYGLFEGQVVIQIHTGSRGLGHQIATDFVRQMQAAAKSFGFGLPDRELACAPFKSPIGQDYFAAMSAAANYAWANRQLITHQVRMALRDYFGIRYEDMPILYDVAHNIAKIEEHIIDGESRKVIVHRKGATRAFPPGHADLPKQYQATGQPVLIPGSMGTASYVMAGRAGSMELSFGSSCHGAGRVMSRSKARKTIDGNKLMDNLSDKGISIHAGSLRGLSEEAPEAYKDVESVVDIVGRAGIAAKVARLKPIAVVKG